MIGDFDHSGATRTERSRDQRVDGVVSSWKWTDSAIRYSAPDGAADYGNDYFSDVDGNGVSAERQRFMPLTATQLDVVRAALDIDYPGALPAAAGFAVEGFTDLTLPDAGAGVGDAEVRIANSGDPNGAYAYLPDASDLGGDVWLGGAGGAPILGNYDHLTIVHELGHALGLKHGHSDGAFGAVPWEYDSLEYTVMTYRSYVGATVDQYDTFERYGAPQGYMMLDVAALQHLYGANYTVSSGDTVYSWRPGSGATRVDAEIALDPGANRIFATIWDGGGTDTYNLSAYETDLVIDLRPGGHSTFDTAQLAYLGGGGNDGFARGNVFNALEYLDDPRSLIENAVGGRGHDTIWGNSADNVLSGRRGGDFLAGGRGDDKVVGGKGADTIAGGAGSDRLIGSKGPDVLKGGEGPDVFEFRRLEDSAPGRVDWLVAAGGAAAFEGAGPWAGDVLDLSRIDANPILAGDQAFTFGDGPALGSIWLLENKTDTHLLARVDQDDKVAFKLKIADGSVRADAYTDDDFFL